MLDGAKLEEYREKWKKKIAFLIKHESRLSEKQQEWLYILKEAFAKQNELTFRQSKTLNSICESVSGRL